MKNVMISYDLFYSLIRYHIFEDLEYETTIKEALEKKVDTLVNHELYTKSKEAPTKEEREKARSEYLDKREIKQDFRW